MEEPNYIWIDDAFRVEKTRFGLWHSYDKEGKQLVTSLTENQCVITTRFYLKGCQEGWDDVSTTKYEGVVGGKL